MGGWSAVNVGVNRSGRRWVKVEKNRKEIRRVQIRYRGGVGGV